MADGNLRSGGDTSSNALYLQDYFSSFGSFVSSRVIFSIDMKSNHWGFYGDIRKL